jgi:hypothetical protein
LRPSRNRFLPQIYLYNLESKPVLSYDLSDAMISLYRAVGIFASEDPVRTTTKRLSELDPNIIYPMHGSCIDKSLFSKYSDAISNSRFAYSGKLLGQQVESF